MNTTFENARRFVYRNARPVDLARWRYHFENGRREDVVAALSAYQNADGGFGHALEADAWNPHSSPIQTWTATEILREIGWTDVHHPVMQGILGFLASGEFFDGRHWQCDIPSNNDYPHAPWWTYQEERCDTDNPTATFAGFLARFADHGSAPYTLGCTLVKKAYETFCSLRTIDDMHLLANYQQMLIYLESANERSLVDMDAFQQALREHIMRAMTKDTDTWKTGYVCRPSRFIASKESVYYADNRALALYECDFLRETQLPDGSWNVPWGWQGYDEQWFVSKNWWKTNIILENLLYLKGMDALTP